MPTDDHQLETAALIALVRRGGRAWHQIAELVEARGGALAVLRGPEPEDKRTLFPAAAEPGTDVVDLDAIAEELHKWEAVGISITTVLDDAYPANLQDRDAADERIRDLADGAVRPEQVRHLLRALVPISERALGRSNYGSDFMSAWRRSGRVVECSQGAQFADGTRVPAIPAGGAHGRQAESRTLPGPRVRRNSATCSRAT
jgi:hypothetical protein